MGSKKKNQGPSYSLTTKLAIAAGVILALPGSVLAEFDASVRVGLVHTDNLRLSSTISEDETVFLLEPTIEYSRRGKLFEADVAYVVQGYHYSDLAENEVFHNINAIGRLLLVPDRFTVELGATRVQAIVNNQVAIPISNLPLSGNRVARDDYFVKPIYTHDLGSGFELATNYAQIWIEVGDPELEDGQTEAPNLQGNRQSEGAFELDNYSRGEGMTVAARYNWERTEYDDATPFEYQKAEFELGAWVSRTVRLFAIIGQESDWDTPLDPGLAADLWEVGAAYRTTNGATATIAVGERNFGTSFRGEFGMPLRSGGLLAIRLFQQPTTQGVQRFRQDDPTEAIIARDLLTQLGQSQRFISNRLEASVTQSFRRLSFEISALVEERTDVTTALGLELPDVDQESLGLSVTYELGARTELSLFGSSNQFDNNLGNAQELVIGGVDFSYKLGARSTIEVSYSYTDQSNLANVGSDQENFISNVVALSFRREF